MNFPYCSLHMFWNVWSRNFLETIINNILIIIRTFFFFQPANIYANMRKQTLMHFCNLILSFF